MAASIYKLLLICGLIAPIVFAVYGLFFLACAFAQISEAWDRRQEKHTHMEEMVSEISRQALQLDEVRLTMFLRWLQNHSVKFQFLRPVGSQVACRSGIKHDLETGVRHWLESFPVWGQLWEYRLVLTEISWWRDLDHARLTKIILECLGNDS